MNERYPHSLKDHTISVVVENNPGVMYRITSLITRRGYNIESICAGDDKEKGLYRITIIVKGDDRGIEHIRKQLHKMIDSVKVSLLDDTNTIEQEMAIIKIKAANGEKKELARLIQVCNAQVIDTSPRGFIVRVTGSPEKINRFIGLFPAVNVAEIARTGVAAIRRWQ